MQMIMDVIHILSILIFFETFFSFTRRHTSYEYLKMIGVIVASSVVNQFDEESAYVILTYIICVGVIFSIRYKERIRKNLCIGYFVMAITMILSLITRTLVLAVYYMWEIPVNNWVNHFVVLVNAFIFLLFRWIVRKSKKRRMRHIKVSYAVALVLLAVADAFVLSKQGMFIWEYAKQDERVLLEPAFLVEIIGVFVQFFAVFFLILSRDDSRERERITRKYLEAQVSHYAYLEQREIETKKFRHDIRGHIFALQTYLQNDQYDALEEHLEQMYGTMEAFGGRITVNNNVADAILNKYDAECKQKGITLKVEGHFPMNFQMSVYDLCTIFTNLLSNAVEAAQTEIVLQIRCTDQEWHIEIENDYSGEVRVENGRIRTRKRDENFHGMGLENVNDCVERNHGIMDIRTKEQKFIVKIELKYAGGVNANCVCG